MPEISNKKRKVNPSVKLIRDKGSFRKRSIYIIGMSALFIFLFTFLVYTPALKNDFVWDDVNYVSENTLIRSLNIHSLYRMLTSFHAGNWHPLTWLSLSLDYAFWGLDPLGYHLTNIILHGLNTLLVFFLIIRLIVKEKVVNGILSQPKIPLSISTKTLIIAGVTSLLFGIHPLHVESVAWVSERKDLLCAFFVLLSILSYLSYTSSVAKNHRRIWFAICFLLFIFALMSKPMAVTLPLILLLLDIYPLKRISLYPGKTGKNSFLLLEKVPFFVLSIASTVITIIAQHSGGALRSLERFPLNARFLNALWTLGFYLKKMMIPVKLAPFYPVSTHIQWSDSSYLLSVVLVASITGFCLWMVKKGYYLFCITWSYYVITLLPVLGIIQIGGQAAADRYTYLPGLSIFLLVGIGVAWLWGKISWSKYKRMIRVILLGYVCTSMLLIGYFTVRQIEVWQNSEVLWKHAIRFFPNRIPEAHYNIGNAYEREGRLDEAIEHFKKAITIKPSYARAHNNLGNAYTKKGMFGKAVAEYKKAIAINPRCEWANYNLGIVFITQGEFDRAIAAFRNTIAINPNCAKAHSSLGNAYDKKGLFDNAITEYKKALAINPNLVDVHANLGVIYAEQGMLDEAISQWKKALAISPNLAEVNYNLASAYYSKGNYKLAILYCNKTIELGGNISPKLLELLKPYR
jgi:tetratricopeptide (TPR) repeat protein